MILPPVQEVARVDFAALPRPGRARFRLPVAATPEDTHLSLAVLVIAGRTPTPRLVCVAGVHGDEHEGGAALLELWDEIDPEEIDGTLVFVPTANPPAFRAAARRSPHDLADMNRVFPGKADGNLTERLAYRLLHDIVVGADLLLSMHGWSTGSLVMPYVEYPRDLPVTPASLAAARAFGVEILEPLDWQPGLLVAAANRAGIPAIEPEVGGLGCTVPERRRIYTRGVRNLMRHLGMLSSSVETPAKQVQVQRTEVYAPEGGVLRRHVELGAGVRGGQPIASIVDLAATPLAEITAPVDGTIACIRLAASIAAGDLLALIFTPLA